MDENLVENVSNRILKSIYYYPNSLQDEIIFKVQDKLLKDREKRSIEQKTLLMFR